MTLVFKKSNTFRNIIRFLKDISSDLSLFFSDEVLTFQTTDIFNKIFIEINMVKEDFKEYKKYENTIINTINLHKMLLFANRFSEVKFDFIEKDMILRILGENIVKNFRVPLNNKTIEKKYIPITYNSKITIQTEELYRIIKKCEEINNNIIIEIIDNKIFFYSQGDFSSINIEKKIENIDLNCRVKLNTKKLLNICKLYKITEYIEIFLNGDFPVKFVSNIDNIQINIFLVQENI